MVHSFTGVQTVEVFTRRAQNNLVTITLPDPPADAGPARAEPGSRTGTLDLKAAIGRRTGGTAVLTGSVLTVMVNKPSANKVQILDEGSAVQVEWNGGSVHPFAGVATILVHTEKATKNDVILDTPPLP